MIEHQPVDGIAGVAAETPNPSPPKDVGASDDDLIENFDPEDPNYREEYDYDLLMEIQQLHKELPEGWKKQDVPGEAPFVHVSGKVSWKHPNRPKIMEVVAKAQKKKAQLEEEAERKSDTNKSYGKSYNPQDAMIKRLKRMVKSGVPLAAVEQRARLEGINDLSVLVDDDDDATLDATTSSPKPSPPSSPSRSRSWKPKDPLKKYRLMRKNGIPMGAIKQTAERDGVELPDEFNEETPSSDAKTTSKMVTTTNKDKDPLKKYRTMLKNGVPLQAVERHMTIDGLDPVLLEEDGGGDGTAPAHPKKSDDASGKVEENAWAAGVLFKPKDGSPASLEFMTFKDGTHEALLAKLVRRMVQTVLKRPGGFHGNTSDRLVVDTQVLYNAMGGFLGVQYQLEQFNKTFEDDGGGMKDVLRKPFLELARNLGISSAHLLDGPTRIPGLDELVDYIKDAHKDQLQAIQSNFNVGVYDFDSLAQIYRPGTKVVAKNAVAGGVDMICQVQWNRYEQGRTLFGVSKYFKVCFVFCVAVGEHFALAEVVEGMEKFDGRRRLKDLQFVPLIAYGQEETDSMMVDFRSRGEMCDRYAVSGANYLSYSKGSFFSKSTGTARTNSAAAFATGGRIMVDTQGAYDYGHTLGVGYDPMIMAIKYKYKEYMLHMRSVKQQKNSDSSSGNAKTDDSDMMLFDKVPNEYLEMTWPAVVGFSLTSKTWGDVLVDGLQEIDFQEKAFDSLVLPASRKRMVKALVRHSSDSFNDVISGKGEGSVFLLYGPPGVGKTLTAEAVSELLHRPLYSVSLGQLGMTPSELESKLGEILELCGKWNALILLDEADIFLEKRSASGSLERNAMVSVMLRLVEYFKGVLFLTSNRVDSLDPAFKTRITLGLRYDALDFEARKQVWKNLLLASGQDLEMFNTDELAQNVLNGREIKNAIRLAMALATEDGDSPLTHEYVLETVNILNDFNEKMNTAEAY